MSCPNVGPPFGRLVQAAATFTGFGPLAQEGVVVLGAKPTKPESKCHEQLSGLRS
jgi:hypothetical protein